MSFPCIYFWQQQLFILMKVIHCHTKTGVISGNFNVVISQLSYIIVLHEKFVHFMFSLISGFKLKSFLIMGIPEGLIIRIVEQCLQDLWHLLLKQNPRLSFHHPSLIRWVKLRMINLLRQVHLTFLLWYFLFWSCLPHPATATCLSFSFPYPRPNPLYISKRSILSVLLYSTECWSITQKRSQTLVIQSSYSMYADDLRIYWAPKDQQGDSILRQVREIPVQKIKQQKEVVWACLQESQGHHCKNCGISNSETWKKD